MIAITTVKKDLEKCFKDKKVVSKAYNSYSEYKEGVYLQKNTLALKTK